MFGVPDDATAPPEPSLDEINVKIPRRVRLSDNGRTGLWIMLASLSIGLIWIGGLSRYLIHQKQQHDALNREGSEALAQITLKQSAKGGPFFYYTFRVAGIDYQNDVQWHGGLGRPGVGSQITVLYLPSDPTINYPKGWSWFDFAYVFFFYFGSLPICIGAYTAWNLLRDHRLARHGWVTEGTVTLCVSKKNSGNFMVDYEFRKQSDYHMQNDDLIEGSNNDCPDEYKTDAKIKVIYLPHHPKRNTSYPLGSYRMVEHKSPDGPFMTERPTR